MSQAQSQFRKEFAIVPPVARVIAVVAFFLMLILFLGVIPHYEHDLPHRPWWLLMSVVGGTVMAVVVLLVGYVNADSKRRGMNSLLWTLLVIFVPKALGLVAYFLLRKPLIMPCPNCGTSIGSDFRYCPKCAHALTPSCQHCGRPVSREYACCPYCGKPVAAPVSP